MYRVERKLTPREVEVMTACNFTYGYDTEIVYDSVAAFKYRNDLYNTLPYALAFLKEFDDGTNSLKPVLLSPKRVGVYTNPSRDLTVLNNASTVVEYNLAVPLLEDKVVQQLSSHINNYLVTREEEDL